MNKIIKVEDFEGIKSKIKNLLTQEGFDDIKVDVPGAVMLITTD